MHSNNEIVNRDYIVNRLKDKGLSMAQVADNMGIDRTYLSKKVNGHREFSAKEAIQLSIMLGLSLDKTVRELGFMDEMPKDAQLLRVGKVGEDLVYRSSGAMELTNLTHPSPNAVVVEFETEACSSAVGKLLNGLRIITVPLKGIKLQCMGRMSIAIEASTGKAYIGNLVVANKEGEGRPVFRVVDGMLPTNKIIEVAHASPVFAMYF